MSAMIWGPPGIGKSSIVAQVAEANGLELIDVRLSQLAPTDLRGLPVADHEQKVSCWYPPNFLPRKGKGILFLDEMNMTLPAIQNIAQQLILDRRVGDYTVPENWFIWAAGNRKEDKASVFEMPAPLANRFIHFPVIPDLESFKHYAIQQHIHEHILAFLSFRPTLLHQPDAQEPAWPSPRSWFRADRLYKIHLDLSSAIGEAAASEFTAFLDLYKHIPDIEAILDGRGKTIPFPEELSMVYALTNALVYRSETVEQITHAFEWIVDQKQAEWVQVFLQDMYQIAKQRKQLAVYGNAITMHPAFTSVMREYFDLRAETYA